MVKVLRPYKYEQSVTSCRVGVCLSTMWVTVVFLTIFIPLAGLHQFESLTALQSECDIYNFVHVFQPNYPVLLIVIFGLIPWITLNVIYMRIVAFLIPRVRSTKRTLQSDLLRQEVKPVVTLLVMITTTGLAYLPIIVVTMLEEYGDSFTVSPALHSVVTWLNYLNLAVNPSVYCLRSNAFRTAWKLNFRHLSPSPDLKAEFVVFNNILLPFVLAERRRSSKVFPDSIEVTLESQSEVNGEQLDLEEIDSSAKS